MGNGLSIIKAIRQRAIDIGNKLPEGVTYSDIEKFVTLYVEECFSQYDIQAKVIDAVVYGSRSKGTGRYDSDIDVVVEYLPIYDIVIKEYVVFNLLHECEVCFCGFVVDINPITINESGSFSEYLLKIEKYEK